jgi:predicted alpha/beta-hydrolase family hydrolase
MTSNAMARRPLEGLRGLVFLGFPLHPPKQLGIARAEHLAQVQAPMLFLQGTRDTLADLGLITGVCQRLGARATLHVVEGADHSFSVLKRSGRTDAQVVEELGDVITDWVRRV